MESHPEHTSAEEPAPEAPSGVPFGGTLTQEVQVRGRERWLSALWAPEEKREMLLALHAYDLEQQHVAGEIEDPLLAEIRLAWWREQLEGMAKGATPERHPTLEALGKAREAGVNLAAFAALGDGVAPVLGDEPLDARKLAKARGVPLFRAVTELLAPRRPVAEEALLAAGGNWGLALLVRGGWGRRAARLAGVVLPEAAPVPGRLPRPLAILARLAAEDVTRYRAQKPLRWEGAPLRLWKMLFARGIT